MRALVQRVKQAAVEVEGTSVGSIGVGLLVFVGVVKGDGEREAKALVEKISGLRIFGDEKGKMNLSVKDVGGGVLVVSQFTLAADCRRGRRPSFDEAASPDDGKRLCDYFAGELMVKGLHVETGRFAAHMDVELVNDGPVTIWLDSNDL